MQTLLQVLCATRAGSSLEDAVTAPRWRSQGGELLVESGHPAREHLLARGHRVIDVDAGADVFGAVVAAGTLPLPHAVADWRRHTVSRGATWTPTP